MLVQAWAQKEKRPDYESAPWQPEPELAQPPPRSVSFSVGFKFFGVVILLVAGTAVCSVCLPSLKHACLTSYGVSTKGTVQQRYSVETLSGRRRIRSYYLVVRYETPSGWQVARIQTSRNYYSASLQSKSLPVHYLARAPSQVVLDDDQLYRPWQVLLVLGFGVFILWLPYCLYRKMRTIAESGVAVKGLITQIDPRFRNPYLTVYYEFQEVPYQATIGIRTGQARTGWRSGKAITLLVAPDPPPSSHRPHAVMVYPAREFKVNL
jgi:hypothetical protein